MNIFDYHRIAVLGNNGSGKSYLAKELSRITGLPLVHLDMEYWGPGWEPPPEEEWIRRQIELTSGEKWIIDGMHTGTMEIRWGAADLVIFLKINRLVCLMGVLRRQNKNRSDMPQYLKKRIDREYFRFLKGLWQFPKIRQKTIEALHTKYPDTPFYVIKGRRRVKFLLDQWAEDGQVLKDGEQNSSAGRLKAGLS